MFLRFIVPILLALLAPAANAFTPAEQYQYDQIISGSPSSLRNAAKSIYNAGGGSPQLLDALAEKLLQNLGQKGNTYIDALAWSCKALASSGNSRYAETLAAAANSAVAHGKLKKHCDKASASLGPAQGPQYKKGSASLTAAPAAATAGAPPAQPAPAQPAGDAQPITAVAIGMSSQEAYAIAGHPTSTSSHRTGKNWIPFNYKGSDTRRTIAHYKGQGRIVMSNSSRYSSEMRVLEILVDPAESGYP